MELGGPASASRSVASNRVDTYHLEPHQLPKIWALSRDLKDFPRLLLPLLRECGVAEFGIFVILLNKILDDRAGLCYISQGCTGKGMAASPPIAPDPCSGLRWRASGRWG